MDALKSATEGMVRLMDDVLDISALERGHYRLERIRFDLCSLVSDLNSEFASVAERRGLSLHCSSVGHPVFVRTDPQRVRQVLSNLLGNALKHAAGVHPDKHRLASLHSRNILDGALLFRYCSLPRPLQRDLALAVGTDRATVLQTLRSVDAQSAWL